MTQNNFTGYFMGVELGDADKRGSLRHLAYVIDGFPHKHTTKEQMIGGLSEYYSEPNRFKQLWKGLNEVERKIVAMNIWSNGDEPNSYADEIAEEYGIAQNNEYAYYYGRNGLTRFMYRYASKTSMLWLLFPNSGYRSPFASELREAVGELQREYSQVSGRLAFFSREARNTDFASIVRCCNTNKLAVTKNGFISKPAALKLANFCGYQEVTSEVDAKPQAVKSVQDLQVTLPLTVLSIIGGLLTVAEGVCIPGVKAASILSQPYEQLVKHLFDAYLKSKSFDEISLMPGLKAKRGHHPFVARQNLVKELKHCLAGEAIYTTEFEQYLRIADKKFARKEHRHVVLKSTGRYDYEISWDSYEHKLIHIIFAFLGALGIIDIAWREDTGQIGTGKPRLPVAFRINPLGAYVLGLAASYSAPVAPAAQAQGGFTVLPDYTIVVPDGAGRVIHELFFEKLFSKVSATEQSVIYRLDFETIVRALNSGASINSLRKYLSASDKPLPENVARALDDWEKQVSRIKLRQVTILECDDAALLEEVIRYKGMGVLVKEKINAAVVADANATKEIKKIIEKNKRFCIDVI